MAGGRGVDRWAAGTGEWGEKYEFALGQSGSGESWGLSGEAASVVQVHETVTTRKRLFSHWSNCKGEHFIRFATVCGFEFPPVLGGAGCRGRRGHCMHVHMYICIGCQCSGQGVV